MRGQQQSAQRRLNGHWQSGKRKPEALTWWEATEEAPWIISGATPAPYVSQIGEKWAAYTNAGIHFTHPGRYRLRWSLYVNYITAKGSRNFRLSAVCRYSEQENGWGLHVPQASTGDPLSAYFLPGTDISQQPTYIRGTAWSSGGISPAFCLPYRTNPHSFDYINDTTTPPIIFELEHVGRWHNLAGLTFDNPPILLLFVCDKNTAPIHVWGRIWFEEVTT